MDLWQQSSRAPYQRLPWQLCESPVRNRNATMDILSVCRSPLSPFSLTSSLSSVSDVEMMELDSSDDGILHRPGDILQSSVTACPRFLQSPGRVSPSALFDRFHITDAMPMCDRVTSSSGALRCRSLGTALSELNAVHHDASIELTLGSSPGILMTEKRFSLMAGGEVADPVRRKGSKLQETVRSDDSESDDSILTTATGATITSRSNGSMCGMQPANLSKSFACSPLVVFGILFVCILTLLAFGYMFQNCLRDEPNVQQICEDLRRSVFGQHIAVDVICTALSDYMHIEKASIGTSRATTGDIPTISLLSRSNSLLVMSFHGWTGIGKNHVASIISRYVAPNDVHKMIVPLHLPHSSTEEATALYNWLLNNATRYCSGIQVFIIDELDKAGPLLQESLHRALLHLTQLHTRAIVLLLTNTGGAAINAHTLKMVDAGVLRDSMTYTDLKDLLVTTDSSTWYSALLADGLISRVVPFLPLERRHVAQCVEAALLALPDAVASQDVIAAVVDSLDYFPAGIGLFSTAGCRKVSSKLYLNAP